MENYYLEILRKENTMISLDENKKSIEKLKNRLVEIGDSL